MESDKKVLKNFLLNDEDFLKEYKNSKTKRSLESVVDETIEYCFYSDFNPYLDKKYLDYTWLENKETSKILNIDDIYEVFKEMLSEE